MRRAVIKTAPALACAALICMGAAPPPAAPAGQPDIWGFMGGSTRLTWNGAALGPPPPGQLSRDLTPAEKAIIMQAAPPPLADDEPGRPQLLLTMRFKLPALIYNTSDGPNFTTIYCGLRTVKTAMVGYDPYQFAVTLQIQNGVVIAASNPRTITMTDEAQLYVRGSYCSTRHYNLDAAYNLPDDQPPPPVS